MYPEGCLVAVGESGEGRGGGGGIGGCIGLLWEFRWGLGWLGGEGTCCGG